MTRHFLRDDDLSPSELVEVLDLADRLKAEPFDHKPLAGPRTVALVFDRPTLRTQVSFAAGIAELGGNPMTVDGGLAAMGSREGVEDVARILGRQAAFNACQRVCPNLATVRLDGARHLACDRYPTASPSDRRRFDQQRPFIGIVLQIEIAALHHERQIPEPRQHDFPPGQVEGETTPDQLTLRREL